MTRVVHRIAAIALFASSVVVSSVAVSPAAAQTVSPAAAQTVSPAAAPSLAQDTREPAVRTAAERVFILGQMRLFLQSTQAITAALSKDDLATVAGQAAARGRTGTPVSEIPAGMKAKETPAWTAMMSGARAGFDGIAKAARDGATPIALVGMLGDTMRNCVACHQTYRLATE